MNLEYIISGIVGLTTGAIGSLIAPWMKWKIEKKKIERSEKQKLIAELRHFVLNIDPKSKDFLNSSNYIIIRPYLESDFVKDLEDPGKTVLFINSLRNGYQAKFLEEIQRIEYDWNLTLSKTGIKNKNHNNSHSGEIVKVEIKEFQSNQ